MQVLSLFDGISGAKQALTNLGVSCTYYASEIDKHASQMALNNHKDIIPLNDVRGVNGKDFAGIDLLIGGSPCQDLSIAKINRESLAGRRSGLFYEYVRILNESKPKYFLLENVASMSSESREIISGELGVNPVMINSAMLTAQHRERLYWTNIPDIYPPSDLGIKLKDILESTVDAKYILSDRGIDYMNRKTKGGRTHFQYGFHNDCDLEKSHCITSNFWRGTPYNVLLDKPERIGTLKGLKNSQANRIWSFDGKSVTLTGMSGGGGAKTGLYYDGYIIRKLTPLECERLQGFPDNYTGGFKDLQRYRALGNSFTVPVISHLLSFIPEICNDLHNKLEEVYTFARVENFGD